jgi:hypothetical protein
MARAGELMGLIAGAAALALGMRFAIAEEMIRSIDTLIVVGVLVIAFALFVALRYLGYVRALHAELSRRLPRGTGG